MKDSTFKTPSLPGILAAAFLAIAVIFSLSACSSSEEAEESAETEEIEYIDDGEESSEETTSLGVLELGQEAVFSDGLVVTVESFETGYTDFTGESATVAQVYFYNGAGEEKTLDLYAGWSSEDSSGTTTPATFLSEDDLTISPILDVDETYETEICFSGEDIACINFDYDSEEVSWQL